MTVRPIGFTLLYVLCALSIVIGIIKFLAIDKYAGHLRGQPARKEKIVKSYLSALKIYKFLVWMLPLYIAAPFLAYRNDRPGFFQLALVEFFLLVIGIQDYIFRRALLGKLQDKIRETK